ncbi:MAG: UDP-glucose/GDP-mannose dehydrogenase family protein [Chlamydiae bacterium]|nr:UDP-glucose/GDP-mannose dehydrogenase family protein [Chlamydiota bacterium]
MKLCIIGTGWVGLVTGICFSEFGHKISFFDLDQKKIELLHQGILPFFEPGLEEMMRKNQKKGLLFFTKDLKTAFSSSEICFLCVSTPSNQDGSCATANLFSAASEIGKQIQSYKLIINKSTSPVGSTDQIAKIIEEKIRERKVEIDFDVACNPEFLREGSAISDCLHPNRIVIGTKDGKSIPILEKIYEPFLSSSKQLLILDFPSAELAKYGANAMLATRISFMNELSGLCEKTGANIKLIQKAIGLDPRIGSAYLQAGIGYGGSCLPKDLRALQATARKHNHPTPLLDAVSQINSSQKSKFIKKIENYYGSLKMVQIAIWGLSFKPETDDLRDAPSRVIIEELLHGGANLRLYDPKAMENAKKILNPEEIAGIQYCTDPYETSINADAIVLITEWKEFLTLDFSKILKLMKGNGFFDGRNQFNEETMQELGFDYFSIGIAKKEKFHASAV